MIEFRMLGALDLRGPDRELGSILSQPKRVALLAWLAAERPFGFQSRDRALALLWPEQDDGHARAALSRAIYWLRQGLGEGVLQSRGDGEIGLNATAFWCDVRAFETSVLEGQHERAVELYRGEALQGFYAAGAAAFEDWLEALRHRLRASAHHAGRARMEAEAAKGNIALATLSARWALEHAPHDETVVRRLLILLDSAGDRAGAVHEYERFARRLDEDLGVSPSPETQDVVASVRTRSIALQSVATSRDERMPASSARESSTSDSASAAPVSELQRQDGSTGQTARRARFGLAGLIAAGAAAVALLVLLPGRPSAANPRRVLVPPFENRSGDAALDRVGLLAADRVRHHLVQAGDIEIATSAAADPGLVIRGAMYHADDTLRLEAAIVSTSGEDVKWALRPLLTRAESPGQALEELAARAAGAIAALANPRFASWLPRGTSTPPKLDAFNEFSRGDERQLRAQYREALPHFLNAARLDSTFSWATLEAARARMRLLEANADSIPRALDRARARLTPLELAWLDWMLANLAEQRDEANRALARAVELAPDRFLYELAASELFLHRPAAAVKLVRHAGPSSPYFVDGARYWDLLADAYHQMGEHARELDVALQIRRYRPTELRGLSRVIRALAALGRADAVFARLDTAVSFPPVPASLAATVLARGDLHSSVGLVMQRAAEELRAHGQKTAALQVLDRAIAWYQGRPPEERETLGHSAELAQAFYLAGRLGDADSLYRRLALADTLNRAVYEGSLGAIAARLGDRAEAERRFQSIERQRIATRPPLKYLLYQQARIAVLSGDPERALRLLQGLFAPGGDFHTDLDFEHVANHPGFREFFRPKG